MATEEFCMVCSVFYLHKRVADTIRMVALRIQDATTDCECALCDTLAEQHSDRPLSSCENVILWRGHFNGTGSETSVNLTIDGGSGQFSEIIL